MREFAKPIVVISKCIEFEPVRWNAQIISSDFVRKLMPYVRFIPVCPEIEIGLGVPRQTLRLVSVNNEFRLVQPDTNHDFTQRMLSFAQSFLDSLPPVDGFILKSGSPTSAFKDAKVYPSTKKSAAITRSPGLFGIAVLQRCPHLAIEDERRLSNPKTIDNFLKKLFTLASFRKVKKSNSIKDLVTFHSENKLLLMAYNQKELNILGRTAANSEKKLFNEIIEDYEKHLFAALKRPPTCGANINVILKAIGYFSENLSKDEKKFFLDFVEKYKEGKIPLNMLSGTLKSWIIRFHVEYLMAQTFFEPYPEGLVDAETMANACNSKTIESKNS